LARPWRASGIQSGGQLDDRDITAEIELWESLRRQRADLSDAVDIIGAKLVERYGISMETAIQRGTDPGLANRHLPVWDLDSGSLVPSALGAWQIHNVTCYEAETPGQGFGYHYKHVTEPSWLSLYFFSGRQSDVASGVDDSRVRRALDLAGNAIEVAVVERGERLEWLMEPAIVTLVVTPDVRLKQVVRVAEITDAAGVRSWESIAVTGFRGGFLKTRCTVRSEDFWNSGRMDEAADGANRDLANFIACYGP
jgi:hypothetical protein